MIDINAVIGFFKLIEFEAFSFVEDDASFRAERYSEGIRPRRDIIRKDLNTFREGIGGNEL